MQVGFIDVICMPLYRVLSDTFPWIRPLYQGTLENRKNWQDLAEKVEMGLTWIDHDTIDKPVEEFTADVDKDIEFTVTTLNCTHSSDPTDTPTPSRQPRPRFSSLRKTRALSKAVRSRLSRSMYNPAGLPTTEKPEEGEKEKPEAVTPVPPRKNKPKHRSKICMLL